MVGFTVKGKEVLVNMDLVCEIHQIKDGGCAMYFSTMYSDNDQAYIKVDQDLEHIKAMLTSLSNPGY